MFQRSTCVCLHIRETSAQRTSRKNVADHLSPCSQRPTWCDRLVTLFRGNGSANGVINSHLVYVVRLHHLGTVNRDWAELHTGLDCAHNSALCWRAHLATLRTLRAPVTTSGGRKKIKALLATPLSYFAARHELLVLQFLSVVTVLNSLWFLLPPSSPVSPCVGPSLLALDVSESLCPACLLFGLDSLVEDKGCTPFILESRTNDLRFTHPTDFRNQTFFNSPKEAPVPPPPTTCVHPSTFKAIEHNGGCDCSHLTRRSQMVTWSVQHTWRMHALFVELCINLHSMSSTHSHSSSENLSGPFRNVISVAPMVRPRQHL